MCVFVVFKKKSITSCNIRSDIQLRYSSSSTSRSFCPMFTFVFIHESRFDPDVQVRKGVGNSYVSAAIARVMEQCLCKMNHHNVGKNKPAPTPNTCENLLLWFF